MKLAFNANESLYTYFSDEPEEGGYSWRKSEYFLYRNFETEKKTDIIEMLGKPTLSTIHCMRPFGKLAIR